MKYTKLLVMFLLLIIIFGFNVLSVYQNGKKLFEGMEGTIPNGERGIKLSDIPEDQKDLYILKSKIVPPVCPKCPTVVNIDKCKSNKDIPPCPPCGRCPKSEFECKKVPIYNENTVGGVMPFINNPPMTPLQR